MDELLNITVWDGKPLSDFLTTDFVLGFAGDLLGVIIISIIGFWLSGWLKRRIINLGLSQPHLDDTLFTFVGNISRYVILGFTALFVMNTFGIQTTSIVAVIGAAGLAIGLALQGTLSNVAAGVMIIVFRPFKLGEFVEVNGQQGTVKSISLNYTELASLANIQIIVPNANVWGNTITNYSTYKTRRAEWVFGVGYGVNLKQAEEVLRKVLADDHRTLNTPEPFIQVNNLGDFSVDFLVRAWVGTDDFFQYQADIKRKVKEEFDAAGIDIPFPTRTVINSGD